MSLFLGLAVSCLIVEDGPDERVPHSCSHAVGNYIYVQLYTADIMAAGCCMPGLQPLFCVCWLVTWPTAFYKTIMTYFMKYIDFRL